MVMNPGAKCYTENGEECVFVATTEDGPVVRPIYESDETGDYCVGDPMLTRRVFSEAPTAVYDQRIATLRENVEALSSRASELRNEIRESESARRKMIDRLSQIPVLERIEAILDGKITHAALFPEHGGEVKVLPLGDAIASDESPRYEKPVKLVTLFGKTGGDLQWKISRYSDGGGSHEYEALFFESESEAIAAARKRISEELAACAADEKKYVRGWVSSAERLGVEVPATLSDRLLKQDLAKRIARVGELTASLREAQDALAAIQEATS